MLRISYAVALLFVSFPLMAATKTWSGALGNLWTFPGNWVGLAAPVAGDDLVFPASAAHQSTANDYPAGTEFHSLTFTGGAYEVGGNAIVVGAGGLAYSGGSSGTPPVLSVAIKLAAPQMWRVPGNAVTFAESEIASLDLNGMSLTLTDAQVYVDGLIVGSGSITENGNSDLESVSPNTATAPLTLNDVATAAIGNPGASSPRGAAYPGPITVNSSNPGFVVFFTGPDAVIGSLTMNAGYYRSNVNQPTMVTSTGDLTLTFNATLGIYLSSSASNANQLNVKGAVNLGNATLDLTTGSTIFAVGTKFTIINNDGTEPVQGTFANLPEGSFVRSRPKTGTTSPQQDFTITYAGGTGNDVVLTAQGVAVRRRPSRHF